MKLLDLLITAIALSMDAFAVSIGKGLSVKQLKASHCLITGAYFGGFQAYAAARLPSGQLVRLVHPEI